MSRPTAVVICPGRGTYGKAELGTIARRFTDRTLLAAFDQIRAAAGQPTLTDVDGASRYDADLHTRSDTASALIYAAALADFRALDQVDVVAVTGNSMGWYTALACAGALTARDGFTVANTMGTLMQTKASGGQLVYPIVSEDWRHDPQKRANLLTLAAEIDARPQHILRLSIDLGGMLVLAGNESGLAAFPDQVPRQGQFPLRLPNHAAFHTSLMQDIAQSGRARLSASLFTQPRVPMIDGRGHVWWPGATDLASLHAYTLEHQVTEPYAFARAISQAAHTFAPDLFVVTGPGTTLGGSVAQSLVRIGWRGMMDRSSFDDRQTDSPLLIAMGRADQRKMVTSAP